MRTDASDRRVIITGASSGLGAALARELARRGASTGLLARRADRLADLADAIRAAGGHARWRAADVTDDAGLIAALDELAEELEGVDIVVANAGFGRSEPPSRFKPGRARTMYDVNLIGMLRLVDWALPRFLECDAGQIVGVSSAASYIAAPHNAAYSGSKAAMRIHLQSLRLSLAPRGIAVTTICPGFVRTELTDLNRHPMPFLWETERAARVMAEAIVRRRGEVVFPWQIKLILGIAIRLPVSLQEALLARTAGRAQ